MYKSIKIPEEVYDDAKALSRELEKSKELTGVHRMNMSIALGYAVSKARENLKRKRKLLASAGVWKDIDTEKLIKDIYDSRKISTRDEVRL
ncbi:MAG: hypothetical protein WAX07_08505 [Candidatus Altiarchaeia archaeon]